MRHIRGVRWGGQGYREMRCEWGERRDMADRRTERCLAATQQTDSGGAGTS